jgi:hypothetical protein
MLLVGLLLWFGFRVVTVRVEWLERCCLGICCGFGLSALSGLLSFGAENRLLLLLPNWLSLLDVFGFRLVSEVTQLHAFALGLSL